MNYGNWGHWIVCRIVSLSFPLVSTTCRMMNRGQTWTHEECSAGWLHKLTIFINTPKSIYFLTNGSGKGGFRGLLHRERRLGTKLVFDLVDVSWEFRTIASFKMMLEQLTWFTHLTPMWVYSTFCSCWYQPLEAERTETEQEPQIYDH